MDLLQQELQRKKQTLEKAKNEVKKKRKYIRQADIRRVEEEQEEQELLRKSIQTSSKSKESREASPTQEVSKNFESKCRSKSRDELKAKSQNSATGDLSPSSITTQLRELGLPVRYFGESHEERFIRLKDAKDQQSSVLAGLSEKEEFRLGKGHGIRNPFLERGEEQSNVKKRKLEKQTKTEEKAEDEEDKGDPTKQIYKFLKGLLKEWESDLMERPEEVARSVAGRNESKTLKQCKDYIRPLFKLCKARKLEPGLEAHLIKIVNFAKDGEFVKAHDAYIDVAIGRAAWPIGVTMVGIHARSGREKIGSSNVAHVMNSELQRKYLTSVKRLLSYAQKKRPDVDPSKKVT